MSEVATLNRPSVTAAGNGSILIIDDEAAIRESLETLLEFEGYSVASAETGEQGLTKIGERPFDLILLDFALPDRNGLEILADIRDRDPQLAVIMITAYGTVDNAVRVIQNGAANFIQKPWDNEKLLADVRAVVGRRRAEQENEQLRRALHKFTFENIVGKSEPMLRVFDLVSQVAPSRSTVLIQGESGTGKEHRQGAAFEFTAQEPDFCAGQHRFHASRPAGIHAVWTCKRCFYQRGVVQKRPV